MSRDYGPLDPEAAQRLLRAIYGDPDRVEPPRCPACGGLCAGGCWKCGARPFCQVISDDGFCRECGADQDEPGLSMEQIVRRDLRAIRGMHAVPDDEN